MRLSLILAILGLRGGLRSLRRLITIVDIDALVEVSIVQDIVVTPVFLLPAPGSSVHEATENRMVRPTWRRPDKDYGCFVCLAWNPTAVITQESAQESVGHCLAGQKRMQRP